jgi:microcompartment protein CcmL/EutN
MKKQSLGLIETAGWVPAVEAADAGTKAADVRLLAFELAGRGLVTIKFLGDVAAVQAAVSAGASSAGKVGRVVSVLVIPRPDRQLRGSFQPGAPSGNGCETKPEPELLTSEPFLPQAKEIEAHPALISPGEERPEQGAADSPFLFPGGVQPEKRKPGRKRKKPKKKDAQ